MEIGWIWVKGLGTNDDLASASRLLIQQVWTEYTCRYPCYIMNSDCLLLNYQISLWQCTAFLPLFTWLSVLCDNYWSILSRYRHTSIIARCTTRRMKIFIIQKNYTKIAETLKVPLTQFLFLAILEVYIFSSITVQTTMIFIK